MLNTSQFFSSLVSQYVGKYNSIAERFGAPTPASSSSPAISTPAASSAGESATQTALTAPRRDAVSLAKAPRLESPATDLARAKQDIFDTKNTPKTTTGASLPNSPAVADRATDPATYSGSFSSLRYGLKLKFDMQAIQKTVYQLSSTQTADKTTIDESFEQLFSGGFGFSADMKLSGVSVNATVTDSGRATESYRQNESILQSREMQRQAEETGQNLPAESRQSYRVAVNRVSLRYKTDAQFSFSNFSRFQSHVEQLNGERPESVEPYTSQVGALAQSAPNEVIGQFFDTVDGYLQNKEDALIENAQRFFDVAAESLGLSADAVETAKASVTNRIESFFDSVESNLNGLESSFKQPVSGDTSGAIAQMPASVDGSQLSELAQGPQNDGQSMLDNLISALRADDNDNDNEKVNENDDHDGDKKVRGHKHNHDDNNAVPVATSEAKHSSEAKEAKEKKERHERSSKAEKNS